MTNRYAYLTLIPLTAVVLIGTAQAQTGAAPAQLVQAAVEKVLATVQTDPETRGGDLGKITLVVQKQFLPYTDFEHTTRLAVGAAWREATPEQRQQFFEQFQTMLVRSYALSLTQLREQNVKFKFEPAKAGSNANDVVVQTHVMNNGEDAQIDYRLQRTPTGWKIYDINMMGAWLIEVYRKQFADVLARDGVPGLLDYLARHNAKSAPH